ncbi:hypothetical protein H6758_00830 [Candidatus Nomurabacteria bacterium]|nr:hypothetical protein [Candidatus Nomurabacteria bacterium]
MSELKRYDKKVAYVVRDIERALGFPDLCDGFFIITNKTEFANEQAKTNERILLIQQKGLLSTASLLQEPLTQAFLKKHSIEQIVVFKPSSIIENQCKQLGLKLLNPPVSLSRQIEEKTTQLDFFADLKKDFPNYTVDTLENLSWPCKPCVLQFNTSHTGSGTLYLAGQSQLDELKEKFPKRPARMVEFIPGPTYTINNVVGSDAIILGNISFQITGIKPFTDNIFATIGNDFAYASKSLQFFQKRKFLKLARKVGTILQSHGWKGAYGIDALWSVTEKRWYLLEINARQPASVTFESSLQGTSTLLEAHMMAMLNIPLSTFRSKRIKNGAQIILRGGKDDNVDTMGLEGKARKLRDKGFSVIKNEKQTSGGELLRIRTTDRLMKTDTKLIENELLEV